MNKQDSAKLALNAMMGRAFRRREANGTIHRMVSWRENGNQIVVSTDQPSGIYFTTWAKFHEFQGDWLPVPESMVPAGQGETPVTTHELLPETMKQIFGFVSENLAEAMRLAKEGGSGLDRARVMATVAQTMINAANTELKARQQLNAKK